MLLLVPLELLCYGRDERVGRIRVGQERREGQDDFIEGQGWRPVVLDYLSVSFNRLQEAGS